MMSSEKVKSSLEVYQISPTMVVRMEVLKDLLPDPTTALFFGKLYALDYTQLSLLLFKLFKTTVVQTLLGEGDMHSTSLQDYIVGIVPEVELMQAGITPAQFSSPTEPYFLPELWEQLNVEVAASIQKLITVLDGQLNLVQGKYGNMLFSTMAKLNRQRAGALGTFEASIDHKMETTNLVVFDVSGSVSRETAELIIDDVVALAYRANASLAIVSNHTFLWEPGTFTRHDVMVTAEFGGTCYETLAPVFDRDWDTVITIADYDSSRDAQRYLRETCAGRIKHLRDISLVNQPTFLAECLGQLADKVTPLLVGSSSNVLTA